MKQTSKMWRTAAGEETLAKYIPAYDRICEKLGQKIAAEAVNIEERLRSAKAMFIDLCKEAFRNQAGNKAQTRFTFTTFDKEFRIEFEIRQEYVRVYRATKPNPSSKDYELVNMDFNKADIMPAVEQMKTYDHPVKLGENSDIHTVKRFGEKIYHSASDIPHEEEHPKGYIDQVHAAERGDVMEGQEPATQKLFDEMMDVGSDVEFKEPTEADYDGSTTSPKTDEIN